MTAPTQYENTPLDELLRLAQDHDNDLVRELATRLEDADEARFGAECDRDSAHEEGHEEGYKEGYEDILERLDGELCEKCAARLEDL